MVIRVTIKTEGDKLLAKKLSKLAHKIKNPLDANKEASVWLHRWVNENFKSAGGKVGGWAPYKYGGRVGPKGKINTSAQLLQDTGDLRKSFNHFWTRNSFGIGSWIPYAEFHEFGTPYLPIRRMLPSGDDPEVVTKTIKIYDAYIKRNAP